MPGGRTDSAGQSRTPPDSLISPSKVPLSQIPLSQTPLSRVSLSQERLCRREMGRSHGGVEPRDRSKEDSGAHTAGAGPDRHDRRPSAYAAVDRGDGDAEEQPSDPAEE